MKSKSRFVLLGGVFLALGYLARLTQDGSASKRDIREVTIRDQDKVYEIFEVKKLRELLNGQIITVVGAVYASPGKEFFLIPDDEVSMLPENLPPEKEIEYSIRLPEWRFRELESGSIYCQVTITGKFGINDGVDIHFEHRHLDVIAPIDSISWNAKLDPQRQQRIQESPDEQGAPVQPPPVPTQK